MLRTILACCAVVTGVATGFARPEPLRLAWPVPRVNDLSHMQPEHLAAALGKDPTKAFEFVRDRVSHHSYRGSLRGARGTLLSMSGNALDRSLLLTELLKNSGQQARLARGTLNDADARRLAMSIFREPADAPPPAASQPSQNAFDSLAASARLDFKDLWDALRAGPGLPPQLVVEHPLASLVEECRDHFWVQVKDADNWVDLDPSFPDAKWGQSFATTSATMDRPPKELVHAVTIRVVIDEHEGDVTTEREVLKYTAPAADLAVARLLLVHVPENWSGPTEDVRGAIEGALKPSEKLKPVLIAGEKPVAGKPFPLKPPTNRGLGGIGGMLGGEGTRRAPKLAVAERIIITSAGPGGETTESVRDVFDLIGPARRAANQKLSADEARAAAEGFDESPMRFGAYDLLITTGPFAPEFAADLVLPDETQNAVNQSPDVGGFLARANLCAAASIDVILSRVRSVVFYPDAPRVQIVSIVASPTRGRQLALDLRRDLCRAVEPNDDAKLCFAAHVLRGVVSGAIERGVIESLTSDAPRDAWPVTLSTSSLMASARKQGIGAVLLREEDNAFDATGVQTDAVARMTSERSGKDWLFAPRQPVQFADAKRIAWWRVDPRSGHTVGVTDDGLHQAVELTVTHDRSRRETTITWRYYVGNARNVTNLVEGDTRTFVTGSREMGRFLRAILSNGRVILHEFVIP